MAPVTVKFQLMEANSRITRDILYPTLNFSTFYVSGKITLASMIGPCETKFQSEFHIFLNDTASMLLPKDETLLEMLDTASQLKEVPDMFLKEYEGAEFNGKQVTLYCTLIPNKNSSIENLKKRSFLDSQSPHMSTFVPLLKRRTTYESSKLKSDIMNSFWPRCPKSARFLLTDNTNDDRAFYHWGSYEQWARCTIS